MDLSGAVGFHEGNKISFKSCYALVVIDGALVYRGDLIFQKLKKLCLLQFCLTNLGIGVRIGRVDTCQLG